MLARNAVLAVARRYAPEMPPKPNGKGRGGSMAANCSVLAGARLLTPEGLKKGHLAIAEGLIKDMGNGSVPMSAENLEGDFLLPGLVELHTDNLEKHLRPRPGLYWPEPGAAMEAHDAQLVSAGITTVLDSVCVGEPVDKGRQVLLDLSLRALEEASDRLRADHRLHLRCEISDPLMGDFFDSVCHHPLLSLVSLMDHTPGQRQYRDLEAYKVYHNLKRVDSEFEALAQQIKERREKHAARHCQKVSEFISKNNVTLATHDDTLPEHIEEALALGATISEFPTTIEAAREAIKNGLAVAMGAPNLVRGGSHSGNVSAMEVAREGLLSVLSSDYVPSSLLSGAFILCRDCGYSLEGALKVVTENPARLGKLGDRGRLVPGLRADLVRVGLSRGRPVVKNVWVTGQRVF
ncbi:MAG: alpha-D-ribose 1-methylphosphonate 5-triphosphate diphosphatase [Deltaproteobacteria bacterium]|jgi:alpha-D-ribose 1-methylphosphonate 5-triphosphate diphosphatase|nr:alpha-D-ribose 1-methylphosphonate 5-triphosphate diphosphatase [Deltaproteobacteria bacterium]